MSLTNDKMIRTSELFNVLHEGAVLPRKAHTEDAGMDVTCPTAEVIEFGKTSFLPLGISFKKGVIPKNCFAKIEARSSYGKKGLVVHGGIIDRGYTGEIKAIVSCATQGAPICISPAEPFLQIVIYNLAPILIVGESDEDRGYNGFGSTTQNPHPWGAGIL